MRIIPFTTLFLILTSCSEKGYRILPVERTLTESVYSSVTIQPDSLYNVYAIVAGIVDKIFVEEGSLVKKNNPLIEITNNAPKLNAQHAKFTLELAQENYYGSSAILSSIKEEIIAAKLRYKNDSINYYRQKNLWEQKIGSKVDYDTKQLNYELALNGLKLLQSKYDRTKNELQTALKQSKNNYQTALITSKDFTVKSKINGKVYALYKEPGEIVNTMEPLASIGSAFNFIIELLVDEVDIVRININQDVLIHLDAYPNHIFKGAVSKIYPQKDERNQTFKVEAIFNKTPDKLYPGLSGEANIVIAKKEKVLTIPKAYLTKDNKVKTDDGLKPITIGLQNMKYVEILSGIDQNTYIYKPEE